MFFYTAYLSRTPITLSQIRSLTKTCPEVDLEDFRDYAYPTQLEFPPTTLNEVLSSIGKNAGEESPRQGYHFQPPCNTIFRSGRADFPGK
jgi:hypothetical protein